MTEICTLIKWSEKNSQSVLDFLSLIWSSKWMSNILPSWGIGNSTLLVLDKTKKKLSLINSDTRKLHASSSWSRLTSRRLRSALSWLSPRLTSSRRSWRFVSFLIACNNHLLGCCQQLEITRGRRREVLHQGGPIHWGGQVTRGEIEGCRVPCWERWEDGKRVKFWLLLKLF